MLVAMLCISNVEFINNLNSYFLLSARFVVYSLALFASFSIFMPDVSRFIKASFCQVYKKIMKMAVRDQGDKISF
jgi:hypothetical protein